jgi:Protein of unknown function (DUF3667)
MSGGEFIGDIAQGALTARAVEPNHGEASDGHTHESACLNCATPLLGKHCHQCGQAAHVHRTLGAFFHDLLHGVLHFEGKIWRTLPLLAFKPGKLTREYIDGRRASYVSPIALFLFVVFLSFAVFNALGDPVHFDPQTPKEAAAALQAADAKLAKLEKEQAEALSKGEELNGIEGQIAGARAAREAIAGLAKSEPAKGAGQFVEREQISNWEPLNEAWRKAKANPDLLVYKLQTNAYKFSWLLIPISVPFVWLLFPLRRRFHLYDHTVFVTYSLSFMLLLAALVSLITLWGQAQWLAGVLLLYAPFHMYRQLRGTYGVSRFGAWWRTWFLSFFAVMALVLFAMSLTFLAAGG